MVCKYNFPFYRWTKFEFYWKYRLKIFNLTLSSKGGRTRRATTNAMEAPKQRILMYCDETWCPHINVGGGDQCYHERLGHASNKRIKHENNRWRCRWTRAKSHIWRHKTCNWERVEQHWNRVRLSESDKPLMWVNNIMYCRRLDAIRDNIITHANRIGRVE